MNNPFDLVTASKLTAVEAVELWCDDKRLDKAGGPESCFINGHRGTGKSMLFRILQYDCQKLLFPKTEPNFLSVYFSVRDSELMTEEIELFQQDSQRNILSESHFALLVLKQLFLVLKANSALIPENLHSEFIEIAKVSVSTAFQFCTPTPPEIGQGFVPVIDAMLNVLEIERLRIVHYLGLRLYEYTRFDGPLFLFDTLLGPLADFIQQKACKTLYILVDDGDDLPESHTVVLNTWIARRNTAVVFKVSTMFNYKTFRTRGRSAIQHPHDFIQYDIATRYLSDHSQDYIGFLKRIAVKRLRTIDVKVKPEDYFPEDQEQKVALANLAAELMEEYKTIYSGRAIRDYAYRHLTSEYVKRLGRGRSTGSYSYSGFKMMATLSSGMVRDFIICAQKMFDNASSENTTGGRPIVITPAIQSYVLKEHANLILDGVSDAKQKRFIGSTSDDWRKISRLIEGLGNIFKAKMLSGDAERRVFSFAFQDEPTEEVERLIDLAISEGYLMKGFISRKEGTGRRVLYVLTRRLAPAFNLDVSAYTGYLSLTTDRVHALMAHGPDRITKNQPNQLSIFGDMQFHTIQAKYPEKVSNETKGEWIMITPEEAGQ